MWSARDRRLERRVFSLWHCGQFVGLFPMDVLPAKHKQTSRHQQEIVKHLLVGLALPGIFVDF